MMLNLFVIIGIVPVRMLYLVIASMLLRVSEYPQLIHGVKKLLNQGEALISFLVEMQTMDCEDSEGDNKQQSSF